MIKSIKEFGIAKSIVATICGVSLGVAAVNYITTPEPCYGYCTSNYNAKLEAKGFVKGVKSEENKSSIYVVDYNSPFSVMSAEVFAEKVDRVLTQGRKGDTLYIRLGSGGGATVSCSHSYEYVNKAKMYGFKVITQIDYLAASCGYMLASASDLIYASHGAQVGNIGAVLTYQDADLMTIMRKYVGGKKHVMGSTRIKELMAGAEPKTKEDFTILRDIAKMHAGQFQKRVLKGRGNRINIAKLPEIFSAKLFYATDALKLGLIDETMDQRSWLQLQHVKGHDIKLVSLNTKQKAPIAQLFGF